MRWEGGEGATETNNLVCTKKQKHIYGNSTHETTKIVLIYSFDAYLDHILGEIKRDI